MGSEMSKQKKKVNYVNNREFSEAVMEYVLLAEEYKLRGEEPPIVPNYIAECFLKIANGLSHKPNFIRYTYKEEMVMDAVENCLTAIKNYNIKTITRGGAPNAFGYFTMIVWRAFLRRLAKEKKQQDIKQKFFDTCGAEAFMEYEIGAHEFDENESIVEELKTRIGLIRVKDEIIRDFAREQKRLENGDDE
jgi:hypothetical protein